MQGARGGGGGRLDSPVARIVGSALLTAGAGGPGTLPIRPRGLGPGRGRVTSRGTIGDEGARGRDRGPGAGGGGPPAPRPRAIAAPAPGPERAGRGERAAGPAAGPAAGGLAARRAIPERLREIQPGFDSDRPRCPQPAYVTKNRRHGGWTGAGGGPGGAGGGGPGGGARGRRAGPGRGGACGGGRWARGPGFTCLWNVQSGIGSGLRVAIRSGNYAAPEAGGRWRGIVGVVVLPGRGRRGRESVGADGLDGRAGELAAWTGGGRPGLGSRRAGSVDGRAWEWAA